MKTGKIFLISIFIIWNSIEFSYAQSLSEQEKVLKEAQKMYDEGEVEGIPNILWPFINDGFSNKQRLDAHHLIILSYLFDDHQREAKATMYKMLQAFPEYEIRPTDPKELAFLHNQFLIKEKFSYGFTMGGNLALPNIAKRNMLSVATGDKSLSSSASFQAGLMLSTNLFRYVNLRADLIYNEYKYGFEQSLENGSITKTDESLQQLSVPVWINPYYPIKEHRLYANLGGGIALPISNKAVVTNTGRTDTYEIKRNNSGLIPFVGGGLGFAYKIPMGFISLEGNYLYGLKYSVAPHNRDRSQDLQSGFGFISDNYLMNGIMISLTYRRIIYSVSGK
jgi:hypothetical protein